MKLIEKESTAFTENVDEVYNIPCLDWCLTKSAVFTYIPCLHSYKDREVCTSFHKKEKIYKPEPVEGVNNALNNDKSDVVISVL